MEDPSYRNVANDIGSSKRAASPKKQRKLLNDPITHPFTENASTPTPENDVFVLNGHSDTKTASSSSIKSQSFSIRARKPARRARMEVAGDVVQSPGTHTSTPTERRKVPRHFEATSSTANAAEAAPRRPSILIAASSSHTSSNPKLNNFKVLQNVILHAKTPKFDNAKVPNTDNVTSVENLAEEVETYMSDDSVSSIQSKISAISDFKLNQSREEEQVASEVEATPDSPSDIQPGEIFYTYDSSGQLVCLQKDEDGQLILLATEDEQQESQSDNKHDIESPMADLVGNEEIVSEEAENECVEVVPLVPHTAEEPVYMIDDAKDPIQLDLLDVGQISIAPINANLAMLLQAQDQCRIVEYAPDSDADEADVDHIESFSHLDITKVILGEGFDAKLVEDQAQSLDLLQLPPDYEPKPILLTNSIALPLVAKKPTKKTKKTRARSKFKNKATFHVTGDSNVNAEIDEQKITKKAIRKAAKSVNSANGDCSEVVQALIVNVDAAETDEFRLMRENDALTKSKVAPTNTPPQGMPPESGEEGKRVLRSKNPSHPDATPANDAQSMIVLPNEVDNKENEEKKMLPAETLNELPTKVSNKRKRLTRNAEDRRTTRSTSSSSRQSPSESNPSEGLSNKVERNIENVIDSVVFGGSEAKTFPIKIQLKSLQFDNEDIPLEISGLRKSPSPGSNHVKRPTKKRKTMNEDKIVENRMIEAQVEDDDDVVFIEDNRTQSPIDITGDNVPKAVTTQATTPYCDVNPFHVGDLVYGRLKYYWPCMITPDPSTNLHCTKVTTYVRYHVHFFGDRGRRAWLSKNSLMIFTGPDTIQKYLETLRSDKRPKKHLKPEIRSCCISTSMQPAWERGVDEAMSLLDKSIAERLDFFQNIFKEMRQKETEQQQSRNRKRQSSENDIKPSIDEIKVEVKEEDHDTEIVHKKPSKKGKKKPSTPESTQVPEMSSIDFDCSVKEEPEETDKTGETVQKSRSDAKRRKVMKFSITNLLNSASKLSSTPKSSKKATKTPKSLKYSTKSSPTKRKSYVIEDLELIMQGQDAERNNGETKPTEDLQSAEKIVKTTLNLKDMTPSRLHQLSKVKSQIDAESEVSDTDSSSKQSGHSSNSKRILFKDVSRLPVCQICFKNNGLVLKCKGNCCSYFHEECATHKEENKVDGEFRCANCQMDVAPVCFACGSTRYLNVEEPRHRCSINGCGRMYHIKCLKHWPQSVVEHSQNEADFVFQCPMHFCHVCTSDNPKQHKRLLPTTKTSRCLKCPATYHTNSYCIPAGTEILSHTQIICPRHVEHRAKRYTINADWCFICSKGGQLMCCETCPTSVHEECIRVNLREDDTFICEECESGRLPLYEDIVWVKFSHYKWWPAVILFPDDIPDAVMRSPHRPGEFVVRFYGTHDHHWISLGRVFHFQVDDSKGSPMKDKDNAFKRAVSEARSALIRHCELKKQRDMSKRKNEKPPPYKKIKVNHIVGKGKQFDTDTSNGSTACNCSFDHLHPCGAESDCLNMLLMAECDPDLCPAKERCENQRFEKRLYPPLVPYRTENRGWGLKSSVDLRHGQFVIEYVGDMIDQDEYARRMSKMNEERAENFYFLTVETNKIIDAGPRGNLARFMNHCCKPNCETQKWTVKGQTRIGLFALSDIPAGTELTFNYNLVAIGAGKKVCICGADVCSGYLGVKNKEPEKKAAATKSSKKAQKRICFICKEADATKECSLKGCSKSYHEHCLCLEVDSSSSSSKWICPRHICNSCPKRAIRSCVRCLEAYCAAHFMGRITLRKRFGYLCKTHLSELDEKSQATTDANENTQEDASKGQEPAT